MFKETYYALTIREQSRSTAVRKNSSMVISSKKKKKHKITYAKMREILLRVVFLAMALREEVVEDVHEEQPKYLLY
jgi:hypothetical protein